MLDAVQQMNYSYISDAGWSSMVARRAHNPKVVGSNPAPATSFRKTSLMAGFLHFRTRISMGLGYNGGISAILQTPQRSAMNTSDNNPFALWQQFWQNANPQMAPFLPPMSAEEVQKKISELQSVELWLSFNLQMVQSQLAVLEQQKLFFNSLNQMSENLNNSKD